MPQPEIDVDALVTVVPMDLPLMPDAPTPPRRVYVAAALDHPLGTWAGARLFAGTSPVDGFRKAFNMASESYVGRALIALPANGPTGSWDRATLLDVLMLEGELETRTEADVLAGANRLFVSTGQSGQGEIIAFCNAELRGPGRYRLTKLIRGRRGTEDQMAGHGGGDRVVLLDRSVGSKDYTLANHLRNLYFRAVLADQDTQEGPVIGPAFLTSRPLKPFAPTLLRGRKSGSDFVITWVRRSREYFNVFDLDKGAPLGAPAELYDVELASAANGSLFRKVTVASPTYTYTAANLAADGLMNGASVVVRVYQLNKDMDAIGRGVPRIETLTVTV